MVRIEENKLVIEFEVNNSSPLEHLSLLRGGIIDAIECISRLNETGERKDNSTFNLCCILRDMEFSERQSDTVNAGLFKDEGSLSKFNANN